MMHISLQRNALRPATLQILPRARPLRANRCRAVIKRQQEAVVTAEEESPFLDPLVRSFLLGVGAGCIVESIHVFTKFLGFMGENDTAADALYALQEQFAPLFVWDHVAALGFWAVLYIMEVMAILSVFNKYQDQETAMRHVRSMMTVSKRMLPISLGFIKRSLYQLSGSSSVNTFPAASAAASPAPATAVDSSILSVTATADNLAAAEPGTPLAFVDVQDVIADVEAQTAAGGSIVGLPDFPSVLPRPKAAGDTSLRERRARKALKPGQWDPEQRDKMGKREQELLERKSYLRNFWYAAALSENLSFNKPLGVDILGSRVVLFRDEDGSVKCLDDTCPHRGAPLSEGWLATEDEAASGKKHTCVVCPYHGWAFDGEGKLRDVPSAEHGKWPQRSIVSSYPVVEKGGFIWLFWGDKRLPADERPPIPFTPELEDPSWYPVYGEIEFDCGHWAVFENAIDMAHIHYLHNDSFGNSEKPRIMDMDTKRDTFHVEATFSIHNKPVNKLWEWTAVESVPVHAKAMLPSSSAITIQLGNGVSMITFVNTVPISENRAVNRFCLIRNFAGWEGFNGYARNAMFKILGEDKVMVEKLTPERLAAEFSLGPDAPQIAFRSLRQEWIDMGYGVPPESVKPRKGLAPDM